MTLGAYQPFAPARRPCSEPFTLNALEHTVLVLQRHIDIEAPANYYLVTR